MTAAESNSVVCGGCMMAKARRVPGEVVGVRGVENGTRVTVTSAVTEAVTERTKRTHLVLGEHRLAWNGDGLEGPSVEAAEKELERDNEVEDG